MSQRSVPDGIRGGGLTLVGSAAGFVLQLASVVVLSRLLRPDDFGVFAMVGVFITLGNLIRDFGMPMAALQAKSLTHQQSSNLFWLNVALAGGTSVVLALASPLLVGLYHEPRLAGIVPAMAIIILLNGVGAQIQTILARKMQFGTLVASDVVGQTVGLAIAIVVAVGGGGYWALVVQGLVAAAISLAWRWIVVRWAPARFRRGHDSAHLYQAGTEYGLAYLLTFAQNNADTIIIGATLGANALGFYNRGYQLLTAPAARLLDPLTQVVVPTLQRARAEGRSVMNLLLRIQFVVGAAVVWLFATAGGSAPRLVPLVLGPGWTQTVAVFEVLSIGGAVWVFSHISYWAFIVNEKSRELLKYNLVSKPLAVASIAIGSGFGIVGVAWGFVAALVISWPLNLIWLSRCVAMPSRKFAHNGLIILISGAVGALTTRALVMWSSSLPAPISVILSVLGGTAAMPVCLGLFPAARLEMRTLRKVPSLLLAHAGKES